MDINQLDNLYKLYRFQLLPVSNSNLRVYSYSSKYFSNADIISLGHINQNELSRVTKEVEDLGFSVKVRNYKTLQEAEDSLFDGFFDIKSSNQHLKASYNDYIKKIEDKVIFGPYEFIKSEYCEVENGQYKNDDIVKTILNNLNNPGPVLILLEAAAGFGKTSTSYELIKYLSEDPNSKKIPLFTELSRNRQATIFKYVLYDEMNSRFSGSNLELINKHIIEGRIPVIIDGFDELLKPKSLERTEDKFEDVEPMLETIKELLQGEAKIVLTTRRTAIFSDDDFFKWLDDNNGAFTFFRYSISEPTISDWIPGTREKALQKAGLNLKSISNPVLLAYLRSMSDEQFSKCLDNIDRIIEDYMVRLMERENERQDLNMSVEEQKTILKIISDHFTNLDITSEAKETLERKILDQEQKLLFEVLDRFSAGNRPSIDQLINKLIIHAFLDRKGDSGHQIGFVNDFILGSFVGSNLIDERENWVGTERFIDFILTAYIPRSESTKRQVYDILNYELLGYVGSQKQVFVDNYLFGMINRDLNDEFFIELEFRNNFNNNKTIKNCIFSNCKFYKVDLTTELENCSNIYFINCEFYDCQFVKSSIDKSEIAFTSCGFTPNVDFSENILNTELVVENKVEVDVYQKKVLEKFWQSGRDRFIPHKRIGTLRLGTPPEEISYIDDAINSLIRMNYIIQRRGQYSVQLNIQYLNEIKKILGR